MPPSKPKPSEIASEAKKTYIPYIAQNFSSQWPATSYLCHSESLIARSPKNQLHPRFGGLHYMTIFDTMHVLNSHLAFYERDPVDVALDWAPGMEVPVPVIMPANDKRAGGDWEAGILSLLTRSDLWHLSR